MAERKEREPNANRTTVERASEREMVVTRLFDAPPHLVFKAWTTPALMKQWWVPKSLGIPLLSCSMDVRTGGSYRLEFGSDPANAMAFFGKYIEVAAPTRLVWTNEESPDGAITTVTFEDVGGKTRLVLRELYPSKESLDEALGGMANGMPESFAQLDELLATL